jgi:hypothetical protein
MLKTLTQRDWNTLYNTIQTRILANANYEGKLNGNVRMPKLSVCFEYKISCQHKKTKSNRLIITEFLIEV